MKNYFCYSLEGSREELEEALVLIEKVAKKEIEHEYLSVSDAKNLIDSKDEIEINIFYILQTEEKKKENKNSHVLKFDIKSRTDEELSELDFERISYTLSNTFKDLIIEARGYLEDSIRTKIFRSKRNSEEYEKSLY